MDKASKRVLVLGIEGFTGMHLSRYLKAHQYEVFGTSYLGESENIFRLDITNKDAITKTLKEVSPEYIVVLSGIASPAHGNRQDFYTINTIGTINILDALLTLKQNPKKIIIASSAAVYGNLGVEVLDESLCPQPANHYGASKYSMECLARNYFEALNIIITRPFNYTGMGQMDDFLIPKIVKHFKENKKHIELGNLHVQREFNDVSYICEAYEKLLASSASSQLVNISSNRATKLLHIIELMQEIAGYKIQVKVNPAFVRKNEIQTLTGSPKKLFSIVGELQQVALKTTLRNMFES